MAARQSGSCATALHKRRSGGRLIAVLLAFIVTAAVLPREAEAQKRDAQSAEEINRGLEPGQEPYNKPTPTYPEPRSASMRAIDVAVLAGALLLATWVILRFRHRLGLTLVLIATLLYFGFYRAGCVCPIGAIQNVVYSLVEPGYTISIVVTAVFLLPIIAALLFGRVFCGGACPLGALQDLLLRKPVAVPLKLDKVLRWGRWLYLGTAIYFVVGGLHLAGRNFTVTRDFIICRFDPFVNVFRLVDGRQVLAHHWANAFHFSGPWWLWIITGVLLAMAVFIGRPYCRWICPYGAILGVCSRVSWKKVTVMPDKCIDCELCNDACPLGAIENHAAVKSSCLACARCYEACPLERQARWLPLPAGAMPATAILPPPSQRPVPIERSPIPGRIVHRHDETLDLGYIEQIVAANGKTGDAALPILQAIQARHRYLPYPAIVRVAELTGVPMAELIGLATFYNHFRLAPIGKHLVKVCCGTACHVAGAKRVSDAVRLYLGLTGEADTDAAKRFTVQEVACIGCCSLAPVMQIDETTFGHLTAETAPKTLDTYTPASKAQKRHITPPPSHDSVLDDKQHHTEEVDA
ncbi:MAG: NAD(P)H-dependent oxidoreductase subunit E [Phycisphaerae bacterium]|nr:NAD(P)H-dependent oxidoreductase subunit E [Phycisphaerae bacterium]